MPASSVRSRAGARVAALFLGLAPPGLARRPGRRQLGVIAGLTAGYGRIGLLFLDLAPPGLARLDVFEVVS